MQQLRFSFFYISLQEWKNGINEWICGKNKSVFDVCEKTSPNIYVLRLKHHSATQTHSSCLTQPSFLPLSAIENNNCWSSFRQWRKCRLSCFGSNAHYEVKHGAFVRALVRLPLRDGVIAGSHCLQHNRIGHRVGNLTGKVGLASSEDGKAPLTVVLPLSEMCGRWRPSTVISMDDLA